MPIPGQIQDAKRPLDWPERTRLLFAVGSEPDWSQLATRLDASGCHGPHLAWSSTPGDVLGLMRRESFDGVILGVLNDAPHTSHRLSDRPPRLDQQIEVLEAIHAAGCEDPVLLLTTGADEQAWVRACELDADIFIGEHPWSSSALVPVIHRLVTRSLVRREQHRLEIDSNRRRNRDQEEATELLGLLHQILCQGRNINEIVSEIPDGFLDEYRELLRAYVIMGTGNLAADIADQARRLADVDASPRQALALHVESLERLIAGLGHRSTRHIMARSDLMALELVVQLGDCYRQQRVT